MRRVLITGSSGFIGTHLADLLVREGYEVAGLDIRTPTVPIDGYTFFKCDILDPKELSAVVGEIRPDTVFHLAARTDIESRFGLNWYRANFDGVKNLLDVVSRDPAVKRCIYTSTQLVCRIGYTPADDEDWCPNTLYGESKVLGEQIIRSAQGGGKSWIIVRPTTIWGPGMRQHYVRFFSLVRRGLYVHFGSQPLRKSYGYIGNTVFQYVKMGQADEEAVEGSTFYLADYAPLLLRDWIDEFRRSFGGPPLRTLPVWSGRVIARIGDCLNWCGYHSFPFNSFRLRNILAEYQVPLENTKKICGQLPFDWEEGIRLTVAWLEHLWNSEFGPRR